MTVRELIQKLLLVQDHDLKVMVMDGNNACGFLRDLNCGPVKAKIRPDDQLMTADCENRVGESVIAIGYGCY